MKSNSILIALLISCSSLLAEHTQVDIPNFTASFGKYPKEVVLTWDTKKDWEYEAYRNTIKEIGGATEKLISEPSDQRKVGNVSDTDGFNPSVSVYYYYLKIRNRKDKYTVGYSQIIKGAPMFMAQSNPRTMGVSSDYGQIIGIVSFGSNKYSDSIAAKNIRLAVSRVMTQTKRFTIIDIDTRDLAQAEIKTMKGEEFMERDIIQKGKSLGAQILVVGSVTNAEVYREGNKYASRVDYELKFIEVETGRSIAAEKFTGDSESLIAASGKIISIASKGLQGLWYTTGKWKALVWSNAAAAALSEADRKDINGKVIDAIDESAGRVNRWTRKTFDFGLEFIKVDEEDKNGVKTVIVEGGEELSMKEGDKLKMVLRTEVETAKGKIVDNEPIAELIVVEVREQTVKCRVDEKGRKKVLENKDKKNMRIIFK